MRILKANVKKDEYNYKILFGSVIHSGDKDNVIFSVTIYNHTVQ